MLTRFLVLFGILAASLCSVASAKAERRVALVIGNSNYVHATTLRNPRNDADDMAAALRKLGFEVQVGIDLDQQRFARTMEQFTRSLDGADVALFYYAGHGLQINDKNYLVSVNAQLANEFLISSETIELDSIVRIMESKVAVNLVFLDACRNNPLVEDLRKSLATLKRSAVVGRGLARVEATGRDTLVAFAAAPGQEAADGVSRNSPFTAALLKHMTTPGLEVSVMLKEVAADVRRATQNAQRPQQLSDMSRTFYFARVEQAAARPAEPQPFASAAAPMRPEDHSLEVAYWTAAQNANQCEAVRAYLQRFPGGLFVELARLSEQRLCSPARRIEVVPAAPAEPAQAAPPAPPPPSRPPAVAALPAPQEAAPPAAKPSTDDLIRPIQLELVRLGCFSGDVNGAWGSGSRKAAAQFKRYAKTSVAVDEPSENLLTALRDREGRICPLDCQRGYRAQGDVCVAIEREKPRRERERARARRDEEREYRRPVRRPAEADMRPYRAPRAEHAAPPVNNAPAKCVIDLGYGRTASCDGSR